MLRFTPYTKAKILNIMNFGDTEIAGFGITDEDPLLVIDFKLTKQDATVASVEFDDEDLGRFADDCVDAGLHPHQFNRVWIHTHPGNSPNPSGTDEESFKRCFNDPDYAIMYILARGGSEYCRIKYRCPSSEYIIPIKVDWEAEFPQSDINAWIDEYNEFVTEPPAPTYVSAIPGVGNTIFPPTNHMRRNWDWELEDSYWSDSDFAALNDPKINKPKKKGKKK